MIIIIIIITSSKTKFCGGYVFGSIGLPCLFVCLSVCLLAGLLKKLWTYFNEIFRKDWR